MRFRTLFQIALVSVGMLGLGACDTVNQTMSDTGDWFSRNNPFHSDQNAASKPVENSNAVTVASNNCMPVSVVDDLKSLSQFSDEQAPRAENNISSVTITNVSSSCTKNDKNYSVDLDITFNGMLGPKAHAWGNKPSYAYPYFVAITQPDGTIVTKEVFGVTLSYTGDQASVEQHEHMRQVIPLQSQTGQPQQVVIGFQLTESQLAYNRSLEGKQNEAAGPVPADIAPAAASEKETKKAVKKKTKAKHKAKKKVVKKAPAPAKAETPAPAPAAESATPEKTETAPAPSPATENTAPPATETAPEVQATPPAQPPANVLSAPAPAPAPTPAPAPASQAAPAPVPAPVPAPAEPAKPEQPQTPSSGSSSGTENLMGNPPSDNGTGTGQ